MSLVRVLIPSMTHCLKDSAHWPTTNRYVDVLQPVLLIVLLIVTWRQDVASRLRLLSRRWQIGLRVRVPLRTPEQVQDLTSLLTTSLHTDYLPQVSEVRCVQDQFELTSPPYLLLATYCFTTYSFLLTGDWRLATTKFSARVWLTSSIFLTAYVYLCGGGDCTPVVKGVIHTK